MTRITVGVPVYDGAAFIAETLRSIQDQTHRDIAVVISLDGPDAAAEAACRPFLDDPRYRLVSHPSRRGWVENVNWLLSQVDTPYWCYHPQDDLINPRYLRCSSRTRRPRPRPPPPTATSPGSAIGKPRSPSHR